MEANQSTTLIVEQTILDDEEIEWNILADTPGSIFKGYETLELESKKAKLAPINLNKYKDLVKRIKEDPGPTHYQV